MEAGVATPSKRSAGRWLAGLFHGRPRIQAGALLAGPVGWLVVGYLGSLAVLLHGVGDSAEGFAPIARALAPQLPDVELLIPDGLAPFDGSELPQMPVGGPYLDSGTIAAISAWIDNGAKQ